MKIFHSTQYFISGNTVSKMPTEVSGIGDVTVSYRLISACNLIEDMDVITKNVHLWCPGSCYQENLYCNPPCPVRSETETEIIPSLYKTGDNLYRIVFANSDQFNGCKLILYNNVGQVCEKKNFITNEMIIDLNKYPTGLFIVSTTANNKIYNYKLIKY